MNVTVVVGYDATPAGRRALVEAAREASLRGDSLTVVNAYHRPGLGWPTAGTPAESGRREAAERVAEEGAAIARSLYPGLDVRAHASAGPRAHVLAEEARNADMLVIGERRHRGYTSLDRGSVSAHALAESGRPVLILGVGRPGADGPVAVALDLHEPAGELLGCAFAEAALRHTGVRVVNVWDEHVVLDYDVYDSQDEAALRIVTELEDGIEAAVARWRAEYPGVRVEAQVLTGAVGDLLIKASRQARLLVVGGRREAAEDDAGRTGHADHAGMRVGPAGHILLHHAECPVMFVPIG